MMTDNEIIKAWECCAKWNNIKDCDDCPAKMGCSPKLANYSLDLVKRKDTRIAELEAENARQRAEIDEDAKHLKILGEATTKQRAEIERLTDHIEKVKSEAYREFAKLVNRRLNSNTPRGAYLYNIMKDVEKELTEGKENVEH